jgi:hypothetical protein
MENKETPKFIDKLIDKGLEGIDSLIDKTDEKYSSNILYQTGQKTGSWLNDLIDKFADFVTSEKKK